MKGVIRWFSKEKGFGFILGEDEKNYFVHIKDIKGLDIPKEKDKVEFEIIKTEKGLKAVNVKIIDKNTKENTDSFVVCNNCNKKIVPRIVFENGTPMRSICPYCGSTYKVFKEIQIEFPILIMVLIGGFFLFMMLIIISSSF